MKKILILCVAFMLVSLMSFAQKPIKGHVFDSSGPLPGVCVQIVGTMCGTMTDLSGQYEIKLPDSKPHILVYSMIGYITKERRTTMQTKIDVFLEDEL